MATFNDQIGREITIDKKPESIVSLVPSITELLYDLGLENELKGRTKFCIHPKGKVNKVQAIGGVMGLDYHKIQQIDPDIIFASREENGMNEINEISKQYPVWVSNVNNLADAQEMIRSIGDVCQVPDKAEEITTNINAEFEKLSEIPDGVIKGVYLVWKNPLYTINKNTFIHDMLRRTGIENLFADKEDSYPKIEEKEIQEKKPDYIFLPSEPYNFTEKEAKEFRKKFPNSEIRRVDGEYFSWYGSHLLKAPSYFKQIL